MTTNALMELAEALATDMDNHAEEMYQGGSSIYDFAERVRALGKPAEAATQLRTAAAEGGEAGWTKGSPEKNAHDAIEGVAAWLMHRFGANTPETQHAQLILDVLPHLHPPTDPGAGRDGERMDWLERQHVEVRKPARFGSFAKFHASPDEEDEPSDLRQRIDNAIAGAAGDATP